MIKIYEKSLVFEEKKNSYLKKLFSGFEEQEPETKNYQIDEILYYFNHIYFVSEQAHLRYGSKNH